MTYQKTISEPIQYEGIGLHTGQKVKLTFKPAPPNTGIVFRRIDLQGNPEVEAKIENVIGVLRGTSIGKGNVKIHTVEHILSACAGLGITNLICELDASEPPAADGSSYEFAKMLQKAAIKLQEYHYPQIMVKEPVVLSSYNQREGYQKYLLVLPSDELRVSFTIDYDHPVIGTQFAEYVINEATFLKEIMPARTFGFVWEKEELQKIGLALGGSVENAIVLDEKSYLNESLRFKDEFVRHKILDLIGDMSLLQAEIKAHFIAIKSGHALNIDMAKILKRKYLDQVQTLEEKEEVSIVVKGVEVEKKEKRRVEAEKMQETKKIQEQEPIVLEKELEIKEIMEILPHRYPFLLVDRVVKMEQGKEAVGIKNVSINEEFFKGHFPNHPIMPGVLIVESMAQVAGICIMYDHKYRGKLPYFAGIDKVRFRKPVLPGDQLEIKIEVLKIKGTIGKVKGEARVRGELVASGDLMFKIV
jgi:UDP-3-O-[3-hydroxymyristoyl] N-acetylglucosamine deacetylase/3-hydroxyacyl-[acyl-carrier-protein] dehydratase